MDPAGSILLLSGSPPPGRPRSRSRRNEPGSWLWDNSVVNVKLLGSVPSGKCRFCYSDLGCSNLGAVVVWDQFQFCNQRCLNAQIDGRFRGEDDIRNTGPNVILHLICTLHFIIAYGIFFPSALHLEKGFLVKCMHQIMRTPWTNCI